MGEATSWAGRTPLGDADLADEIELYGAVVVAASEKEGRLSPAEIDAALGLSPSSPPAPADGEPEHPAPVNTRHL